MEKFLLLFILFALTPWLRAASATDPIVDLGTLAFSTDNPAVWTFQQQARDQITSFKTDNITQLSGTGATWTRGTYTPFNLTGLQKRNKSRYVFLKSLGQNPDPLYDPTCGTLAITNIKLHTLSDYYTARQLDKTNGNSPQLYNFQNGFYIAFDAAVTALAGKGTCTLTQTLAGWLSYAESGGKQGTTPPDPSEYASVNFTFTITLITEGTSLEHDEGAALNFGTFCRSTQTQTLTVPPAGNAQKDSSMLCPLSMDVSADSFTFKSSQASTFSVNFPQPTITLSGPGNNVQVSNFTSSCSNSCTLTNHTANIAVGGTITVPGNSPTGEYMGNYPISITY